MIIGHDMINQYIDNPESHGRGIFISVPDDDATPFSQDSQVGRDSIDLRIGTTAFRIRKNSGVINTLGKKLDQHFQEFSIGENGYTLMPGEMIIVGTVERIKLDGDLMGQITGRTRYARMGLAVHCTATKFQGYSDAVVVLQLINHGSAPLLIFPYQKLAQLIIYGIDGYPNELRGSYYNEEKPKIPSYDPKELAQYNSRLMSRYSGIEPKRIIVGSNVITNRTYSSIFSGIATIASLTVGVLFAIQVPQQTQFIAFWVSITCILLSSIVSIIFDKRSGQDSLIKEDNL